MAELAPQPLPPSGEDKTTAIVAYVTLIGFIIAVVLHGRKKTALGSYHLRQMLGLILTLFLGLIVVQGAVFSLFGSLEFSSDAVIYYLLFVIFYILMVVLWFMGLISAANGEMKPTVLLGRQYQEWFRNAFN